MDWIPDSKRLIWISNVNTYNFIFSPLIFFLAASFRAMRVNSLNVAHNFKFPAFYDFQHKRNAVTIF